MKKEEKGWNNVRKRGKGKEKKRKRVSYKDRE